MTAMLKMWAQENTLTECKLYKNREKVDSCCRDKAGAMERGQEGEWMPTECQQQGQIGTESQEAK